MWSRLDDEWIQLEEGRSCLRGGQWNDELKSSFPKKKTVWFFLFSQFWQRPSLIPIVWSGLRDTCIYRPINGKLCPTFMELRMVIQCEHLIWSRILCLFNQAQATASKWKKGKMRLRVLINNVWIFKRNVYVLTNNARVFKMMSVFVCEKELCVNIFIDCCKVLAAPLKRTFPPFFNNRMSLLKRQSRNKNIFLTQLASQNSVYSKCKINWFDFDSVFKHVWKVLYCFLFKSFLINVLITFQRNLDIMQISKSGNFANVMWAKKAQNILTLFFELNIFLFWSHTVKLFFQRRQNDMKVEWKKQAVAIQRNASNKQ